VKLEHPITPDPMWIDFSEKSIDNNYYLFSVRGFDGKGPASFPQVALCSPFVVIVVVCFDEG